MQNQTDKEFADNEARSGMNKFIRRLQRYHPRLPVTGRCIVGKVTEVIVDEAAKQEAVLIVMGTLGATGLEHVLLGSTAFSVIRSARVPVLAVPKRTRKFQLQKIGFTTNFHAVEIPALDRLIELLGPEIDIVPFHLFSAGRSVEEAKMKTWQSRVSRMIAVKPAEFRLVRMRSHLPGIRNFIKKEKLDALVMTRIEKRFLERLLRKSLVKAVADQCPIPVLFIPET